MNSTHTLRTSSDEFASGSAILYADPERATPATRVVWREPLDLRLLTRSTRRPWRPRQRPRRSPTLRGGGPVRATVPVVDWMRHWRDRYERLDGPDGRPRNKAARPSPRSKVRLCLRKSGDGLVARPDRLAYRSKRTRRGMAPITLRRWQGVEKTPARGRPPRVCRDRAGRGYASRRGAGTHTHPRAHRPLRNVAGDRPRLGRPHEPCIVWLGPTPKRLRRPQPRPRPLSQSSSTPAATATATPDALTPIVVGQPLRPSATSTWRPGPRGRSPA